MKSFITIKNYYVVYDYGKVWYESYGKAYKECVFYLITKNQHYIANKLEVINRMISKVETKIDIERELL